MSLDQTYYLSPLPDEFKTVMSYFSFFSFDLSTVAYPSGCLETWFGYSARLLVTSLPPFLIIACVLLIAYGSEFKARSRAFKNGLELKMDRRFASERVSTTSPTFLKNGLELKMKRKFTSERISTTSPTRIASVVSSEAFPPPSSKPVRAVYSALLVVFICLPSVSGTIFSAWVCESYQVAPGNTKSFLLKDLSVECGSSDHRAVQAVAYVLLAVWPVGMLALFASVLFCNRKELRAGEPRNTCAKAASFLTSGYRNEYFYWEVVELARRLLVSGWVLLIPYDKMFFRLAFAWCISFLLLLLTAVARPWSRPEDNVLGLVSQAALVLAFGCCLLIKIVNYPRSDLTAHEELNGMLGFTTTAGPFFILCFIPLSFLFVLLTMFANEVHRGFSLLLAKRRNGEGNRAARYSSLSFLAGACILGLPAGALSGFFFGVWGGFVGAAIFGSCGAVLGVALMEAIQRRLQQLLGRHQVDELLSPDLQDVFDEIAGDNFGGRKMAKKLSERIKGHSRSSAPSSGRASSDEGDYAGARVRAQLELIRPLLPQAEASALLTSVAERIREKEYTLKAFHEDMVKCFPELQLYLGGCAPAADTVEASTAILRSKGVQPESAGATSVTTSGGRPGHVEYCRTFGALFCVYWLMRLELDEVDGSAGLGGQVGFCFGVDENTMKATLPEALQGAHGAERKSGSSKVVAPTGEAKRLAFLRSHDWTAIQLLMIDSGILTRTEGGSVAVCVERTRAMLVLTAIHDVNEKPG